MTTQFLTVMATPAACFFFAAAARASQRAKTATHERDVFYDQLMEWEPIVTAYAEQVEQRDRSAILN